MKTLFLKNAIPVIIAVLAIAGAFATTSMQNSPPNVFALKTGFVLEPTGECNIPVICGDFPGQICKFSYPNGDFAFQKNIAGNCNIVLYRP